MPEQGGTDGRIWRVTGSPLVAGRRLANGTRPLDGETVAVKDLFAVAGQPIGAGVPAYLAEATVQPVSAPAVQALIDACAVVLGIAQTDEYAYCISCANPHNGTPP
ncbi:MAG: amidase, partial [Microbacteriaceae bacterium]|nr:amidase [Microbacteriaceae bacterium]